MILKLSGKFNREGKEEEKTEKKGEKRESACFTSTLTIIICSIMQQYRLTENLNEY